MLILRPYQETLKAEIYKQWQEGHKNVLAVMPTGGGKTKTFCSIANEMAILPTGPRLPTAIMVHRKELVQQICLTLAEEEIKHNIIAPRPIILGIIAAQRRLFGKQFYNYNAPITVLSVDTLNSRIEKNHTEWAKTIRLWITDEAAHLLAKNKWGKAVSYFPNAIGLGVTATPQRLDKRGLGRHADGVFDVMVQGPNTKWMIDNGFLCKYQIARPASDYRQYLKDASEGSDFSREAMQEASLKSHIVGDAVENYIKFARGKQAIYFVDSIITGNRMENEFKQQGISAKLLTGETPDKERLDALIEFQEKRTNVLLNVDLFDEGLDVPGIEIVGMCRPTLSTGKYLQMCGRGLRPAKGKEYLLIIDHVGNTAYHGPPHMARRWTLDRIVKRRGNLNLVRICSNEICNAPYDRAETECPWCGEVAIKGGGGGGGGKPPLEQIDGDLHLLSYDVLQAMEQATILEDPAKVAERVSLAVNSAAGISAMKNQIRRKQVQTELSEAIAYWAGRQRAHGYSNRAIHKKFYLTFGQTITEALSEPAAAMEQTIDDVKRDRW